LTKYGSIENFGSVDLPAPEPKRGQIRVRVHASAVGPGDGQTRWKIGDPVFGFLPYGTGNNQGAFAEFLVTPENQVARKPSSVSHEQAAGSATAAVTALQGIRD
jgi:NADPH:quinone reductase-like Zn-dependent oxidoreductase